ncbi:unnamed protein product [Alternaria alternata]
MPARGLLKAVAILLNFRAILAINQCPTSETYYTGPLNGAKWGICQNTDVTGNILAQFSGLRNVGDCAWRCDNDIRCTQAVWVPGGGNCYLKDASTNGNWVTSNGGYSVIHQVDNLDRCPATETNYPGPKAGANWSICSGTDATGNILAQFSGLGNVGDCAWRCDYDDRCVRAVWVPGGGNCYLKDGSSTWTSTTGGYSVVHVSSPLDRCPNKETTYKTADGATWAICPGSDITGNNLAQYGGLMSAQDCASRCNDNGKCLRAVFVANSGWCYLKDHAAHGTWTSAPYTTVRYISANPTTQGQWSALVTLPVIPAALYAVPAYPDSSRLLFFSSASPTMFGGGGKTIYADYNYRTGAVSQRTVSNTQHDMFCPGMSQLGDGRIVVTGGDNAEITSIYDPATNDWTRGPNMKISRGYQSQTTLSNGGIFTIGGSWSGGNGGKNGEIYDPSSNTWTLLNGASVSNMLTADKAGSYRADNHAWLYGWKNGSVFQAGPSVKQNWYTTSNGGSVQQAGTRNSGDQMCGITVMFDNGKILSAGGSPNYDDSDSITAAYITTISDASQPVKNDQVSNMNYPRIFANAVVLPDGIVHVTGGQTHGKGFADDNGVLSSELFNPVSNSWTIMARESVARNYHSASVLLADARVWSGGGGLCYNGGDCRPGSDHPNGQIWSPPYLFNSDGSAAARPVISSVSSTTIRTGVSFTVQMGDSNSYKFSLIRLGSATHSVNTDQRRIPVSGTKNGNSWSIMLPSDSGVMIPGSWHIFALNGNGVPSWAKTVKITN